MVQNNQSYNYHRDKVIQNLRRYATGELKGKELEEFKYHNKMASELMRDIDRKIPSKPHSKFYDLMNK